MSAHLRGRGKFKCTYTYTRTHTYTSDTCTSLEVHAVAWNTYQEPNVKYECVPKLAHPIFLYKGDPHLPDYSSEFMSLFIIIL